MSSKPSDKDDTVDSQGMDYLESLPRRGGHRLPAAAVFLIVLLFPFYWMAITAFKPNDELLSREDNPFWVIEPDAGAHQEAAVRDLLSAMAVEHDAGVGGLDLHLARLRACSRPTRSSGCASTARATSG